MEFYCHCVTILWSWNGHCLGAESTQLIFDSAMDGLIRQSVDFEAGPDRTGQARGEIALTLGFGD